MFPKPSPMKLSISFPPAAVLLSGYDDDGDSDDGGRSDVWKGVSCKVARFPHLLLHPSVGRDEWWSSSPPRLFSLGFVHSTLPCMQQQAYDSRDKSDNRREGGGEKKGHSISATLSRLSEGGTRIPCSFPCFMMFSYNHITRD